jgi:hypothetical protein
MTSKSTNSTDRTDAQRIGLAARTLPCLQRSVKWDMTWFGVADVWWFSWTGFARHVKLNFGRGTSLAPVHRSGWGRPHRHRDRRDWFTEI